MSHIMNTGILSDFRKFLTGVSVQSSSIKSRNESDCLEIVQTATNLLKHLPASREAVLYYFCQVIDESIKQHLIQQTTAESPAHKKRIFDRDATINMIHDSLSSLVKWNPDGWAPIISTWSLRLLGQMSSYHSPQLRLGHMDSSLNDTLQVWLSCPTTRMLINLTTQCLEDLTPSETGACINALLETSVEHSPHFDWVVAHLGGCFPHTIVNRVLQCGLQDFVLYGGETSNISPKLKSVVGILAHLSFSHLVNVQKAVLDLLLWSNVGMTELHAAVVPYLLQLSSLSLDLLDIITEQGVKAINKSSVAELCKHSAVWCSKYFNNEAAILHLVVQQVIRSRQGGLELVKILLEHGATEFTETLLNEMAQLVQASSRSGPPAEVALIQSLQPDLSAVCRLLLAGGDPWQQAAVLRLLTWTATVLGPGVSNHVVSWLLQQRHGTPGHNVIQAVRTLILSVQGVHPQVVNVSVHEVLHLEGQPLENALLHLVQLVLIERSEFEPSVRCRFQEAVNLNLDLFPGLFFQDKKIPFLACKLLNLVRLPELVRPQLVARLAYSCVPFLFTVAAMPGQGKKEAVRILATLSAYPNGQELILRLLIQGVFSHEWKPLFGAETQPPRFRQNAPAPQSSLLIQNRNFCSSVTLPQRHSSVFHAGIIGNGIRHPPTGEAGSAGSKQTTTGDVEVNINLLLDTLTQCCSRLDRSSGMTQLSLLLVEIVSPDVMFNGLPWPDEEFTKVTVERDLHIRRFVTEHIVVWDLLNLLAHHRPSLCYCSVLLRAILATLLSHWANCQEKLARDSPSALDMTRRLIDLMAIGQLLPPPLSYLSEIVGFISPHEVHILLKDVWAFMRDNVPAPALFAVKDKANVFRDFSDYKMEPRYTERLRLIMLANITSVGHLYPRFLAPPDPY